MAALSPYMDHPSSSGAPFPDPTHLKPRVFNGISVRSPGARRNPATRRSRSGCAWAEWTAPPANLRSRERPLRSPLTRMAATGTERTPLTFDVHELDSFLLVGSAVTLLAILAVRVSSRAGLPSLLVYLLMEIALGASGLPFKDAAMAHALGFAALVVILAEGGLTTHWPTIRPAIRLGLSLATLGVAVSVT